MIKLYEIIFTKFCFRLVKYLYQYSKYYGYYFLASTEDNC